MAEFERFATATDPTDPLLACSMCRCLPREAVLLNCLHNCCRPCFSTAVTEGCCREGVRCRSCGAVTEVGSEQPNGFIDCQVQRYKTIAESKWCSKCRENGDHDKPALVWCPTCRYSLCGECLALHRQFHRLHVTQSLEELKSLEEVCSQPSVAACGIHGKPLDIVCLNCEEAKCTSCWASCKEKSHEVHIVSEKSFDGYVSSLVACISSIENELLRKSAVLEKPKIVLQDTKAARDRHLEDLNKRKRRVVEAVEEVYEKVALFTKEAFDEIETEGVAEAETAERIASDLSDARSYIRRLVDSKEKCELFKQQKKMIGRLSTLSAELDNLSERLATMMREVKIEGWLPESVEDVVRAWIGTPRTYSASVAAPAPQQQRSFSFGATSGSLKLPVHCWDFALTKDGRSLLFAAWENGFFELSSSCGHILSYWRPPQLTNNKRENDWVLAVTALSDGRAAVSVRFAQLVVLLRRSQEDISSTDEDAAGVFAWIEDRRIDTLPWPVWCLSSHGDVLAASECTLTEQTKSSCAGQRLLLLSLSNGQQLSAELQREYDIDILAVAADTVVTGSYEKTELVGGRRAARVLDAHSLADDGSDKRLWRHVLRCSSSSATTTQKKSGKEEKKEEEVEKKKHDEVVEAVVEVELLHDNEEENEKQEEVKEVGAYKEEGEDEDEELLLSVCLDSRGGCLYAAVCWSDRNIRLSALSLADGSELRRFALSFTSAAAAAAAHPKLLLPWRLSLCEDGAASAAAAEQQLSSGRRVLLLAALCWDETTEELRAVTLHRSTSDE